jgi:L-amino acid N-acyltransferase YncA
MKCRAGVALRAATEADMGAIVAIYAHHVQSGTATFEIDPPDTSEMTGRWRDVIDRGLPYLVATRGEEIVAYAYAGPHRPRPAYRFTVEDSIYVRADCAGQGIGSALLTALIAASESAGARQMVAVIGDAANAASIRVHAAAGFEHAGVLRSVGWKFGRWLDVVLMQRALGPGGARPAV